MLAHCNIKENMRLCSKQSSLFFFYALPSGGKSKEAVVHFLVFFINTTELPLGLIQPSSVSTEELHDSANHIHGFQPKKFITYL